MVLSLKKREINQKERKMEETCCKKIEEAIQDGSIIKTWCDYCEVYHYEHSGISVFKCPFCKEDLVT